MRELPSADHGHIREYISARLTNNSSLIFTLHLSVILVSTWFEARKKLDLFGTSCFGITVAEVFDEHLCQLFSDMCSVLNNEEGFFSLH